MPDTPPQPDHYEVIESVWPDLLVICPSCNNGMVVNGPVWVDGVGDEINRSTRVCAYCGVESEVMTPRHDYNRKE